MLLIFVQSLLVTVFVSHVGVAVIYYVKPDYDDHSSMSNCPYQHCHDLNYYTNISLDHHSVLLFLSGEFILSSDLMIRDVHSISLIGSKDDNSVVNSIIQCNSSSSVIMINITELTVRNIVIKNCGPTEGENKGHFMMRFHHRRYGKQAVVIYYCISVQLEELTIITNGLLVMNLMGNCFMVNVSVNGLFLLYNNSRADEHSSFLEIKIYSYVAIQYKIMLFFSSENFEINITISNAIFSFYRTFKLIDITGDAHVDYMIHIEQTHFIHNQMNFILSDITPSNRYRGFDNIIKFSDCTFLNNSMLDNNYLIDNNRLYTASWTDCLFHKNNNLKLFFLNIQITDIIIKNTTFSSNTWNIPLINIFMASLIFYGPVKFTNNTGNSYLLKFNAVHFTCYNYIVILHNHIKGLLHTYYYRMTINLKENSKLEVKYNNFSDYFAISQQVPKPYPECFFQYISNKNYDKIWYQDKKINYSISFIDNHMKPLPYSYIAECDWSISSAFKDVIPLEVNKHIIVYKNQQPIKFLTTNKRDICLCETMRSFDCTVNRLGPIYPGETILTKIAIPYFWDSGIYMEFKVLWKRATTCQFDENTIRNLFLIFAQYHYCSMSNLTILATQEKWCALVLYDDEYGDIKPAVFYVMLYPGCPMGFAKYGNKCDCDRVLGKLFNFTCNINDHTILRPGNSWISATTNNNYSHSYTVCQICPFDYCLPHSSYLHLSHPNSQCQFNRSGLLCGQCQQGLSTVFGSSQCERCSNVYLLSVLLFAVLGILLVFALFVINITVTDGTINAFIFYVNIVSINGTIFFPLHQFSYVVISIANLDLGIKTCFYNGMDDYAKMWLQLAFPLYLIIIAASLIIASRYSTRIQRLTARRALPVLATLFLLSYTKMLRTTCNVLFLYSRVIYLPSNNTELVWSVDANVAVFQVKFMILFIACLVLFSIMIPFNVILIFTRSLFRFKLISKFKPLIDAYQGAYKDKCYYWIGLQLVMRAMFLGLSSLDRDINLKVGIILISILAGVHGLARPFKSRFKNYQEFIWLTNLQVLHVLSFNITNMMYVNILVTIAMVHFSIIIVYHVMTHTWIGKVTSSCIISWCSNVYTLLSKLIKSRKSENIPIVRDREMNEIPDVTYNYREYREPLIAF